jgi:hypothetical protein
MTDYAPYFSAIRSFAIFASGIGATLGLTSPGESSDIVSGVDHIIAGSKEIIVGVSMLTPVAMGVWGVWTHRPAAVVDAALTHHKDDVVAAVATMPGPEKLAAFIGIPDSAKMASVEALPDVAKIVVKPTASDGVADAAADRTRPKVVVEPAFGKGA